MLRAVADEIKRYNLKGSGAEVGVFRGDFAREINCCFLKKNFIYLIHLKDLE